MRYSTQTLALARKIGIKSAVRTILDAGFQAIDMTMSYGEERYALADDYKSLARELRSMAEDRGAVFNQAHAPFGGGNEFYLEKTVPNFPRIFEFAGLLGAECIVVHPLILAPHTERHEESFDANMEFYTRIAPYAVDYGIKIAIENMWERAPQTGKIIPSTCDNPEEHARYFDSLGDSRAFTLCLDVGHTALTGGSPDRSVRVLRERLGALHLHDVDGVSDLHTLPGLGKIDWALLTRALGEINYKGYLTLECDKGYLDSFGEADVPAALARMRERVSALADEVDSYRKI